MKQYDDIVIGAGISGMTAAMLLAETGRKVLLLEKSSHIGGSVQRFKRMGVPFDTGFHFTAGLGGVLTEMLEALGFDNMVEKVPFAAPGGFRIYLEENDEMILFPGNRLDLEKMLCKKYTDQAEAIRQYFIDEKWIFDSTPIMNLASLKKLNLENIILEEDFITLNEYFDKAGFSRTVRTLLSAVAICHGTPPGEVSFANHCRISYGLHDNVATIKQGGQVFIDCFKRRASELPIDIICNNHVESFDNIKNKTAHLARLNNGENISFENVIFSIHPGQIPNVLPQELVSKAFCERVNDFQDTFSFSMVYCVLDKHMEDFPITLTSYIPTCDIDAIMNLKTDKGAWAFMSCVESGMDCKPVQVLNAFTPSRVEDFAEWADCPNRGDNADYQAKKIATAKEAVSIIELIYPQFKGLVKVVASATPLTMCDYLNSGGSAYGIKHLLGQHNVLGRLPMRNGYAVGQNSLLPGVIGAMLSSFIVCNKILC